MAVSLENLPDDVEALKALFLKEITRRDEALKEKESKISYLEELLRIFQHRKFAASSENWPGQPLLFNEAEESQRDHEVLSAKIEAHTRRRPKRRPLPAELPRIERVHELAESEKACPCGGCLKEFSEEISEQLDVVPARLQVIRHVRKKYSCSSCKSVIKTAPLPAQALPRTKASPGLLAYVATAKYVDHLPLYRQEEIFRRLGVDMPRATLARWMVGLSELLRPLYNLMEEDLTAGSVLLMDETPIQVLKGSGKAATSQNYMWVRCRSGPGKNVVLFHYDPSRSSACAKQLLADFSGYLVSDGYEGYGAVVKTRHDLIHCGCWDHARRRFFDAVKSGGKTDKASLAEVGLSYIQSLYVIERSVKDADAKRRFIVRNLYSRSVLRHLRGWLDRVKDTVPPKTLLGKALGYLHDQWENLTRYLEDSDIPISNVMAENAIRPFALGRKNWMFSDTVAGAEASAVLYSIIETAKANEKEPYSYLCHVVENLPRLTTADEIATLLPYS